MAAPECSRVLPTVRARIERMAETVGCLRRVLPDDQTARYGSILADRLANDIRTLTALTEPCAAELLLDAGFHDHGVAAALDAVDERDRQLERLLGGSAA
jgi:hypothetical protein